MSNDDSVSVFTSDKRTHTLTLQKANDLAASFATELCTEVRRLQKEDTFTPERVADFVRDHRLGARLLMR